jgi:hypothetical protein
MPTTSSIEIDALFADALPGVVVEVTEWHQLPDGAAMVLTGEPGGAAIIIHNYHGPTEPRALVCQKHGIQRHDWDGRRYVCKVCGK